MKTTYKISLILAYLGMAFWLLETIFFLFVEGWHWKATSQAELICDKIVGYIMLLAYIFLIIAVISTVQWAIKAKDDIVLLFQLLEKNTDVTRHNSATFMSVMDGIKQAFDNLNKKNVPEEDIQKPE